MIEIPRKQDSTEILLPNKETTPADGMPQVPVTRIFTRLVNAARHYPLPLSVLALLLISLIAWLVGWHNVAQWSLIAIILLGGIPLLWATLRQLAHGEVGVDVIAILAIGGSLMRGR